MSKAKPSYGNESISSLKGADRVRKRPGVIFGSDGLEGCEHAVFEILSNSIDEAREGHGTEIVTTRYADGSIEVADHGRGIPIEWNENEQRYNWELVFCELYAGGKYKNDTGENYEFSLGLNGLGTCATQYSSEYMDVTVIRDGFEYGLHFEKGENKTGTKEGYTKKATNARKTGTTIRWKPDLEVFTDINIPVDYYLDTLKRQAVCAEKSGGKQVRDHRISLSERHCGLCDRAGRRESADLGAVPRGRTTRTRPRRQGRVQGEAVVRVLLLLVGVADRVLP